MVLKNNYYLESNNSGNNWIKFEKKKSSVDVGSGHIVVTNHTVVVGSWLIII